jgi:hypothetical protein
MTWDYIAPNLVTPQVALTPLLALRSMTPDLVSLAVEPQTVRKKTTSETLSVPEAGKRYYGLSRNGSYDAARRGEIPTIAVGRLLRVPVRAMERKLDRVGENDGA